MTINAAPPAQGVADGEEAARRRPHIVVRRPIIFGSLATLAGALLTVIILPPPMYADSQYVWRAAQLWPSIPPDFPVLHHAMRLGTVLPTRLMQEIFGSGHLAWVAAAALFAALFTAGTYAIGRVLFGDLIGLLAVGILVVHPFFTLVDPYTEAVANSTGGLFPDMPAAGLFSLGVAALVVGARRDGRSQIAWLVAAGGFFGLAYLTREFAAFMFPAIPVFFLLLRIPLRRLVVLCGPMIGILGLELMHNAMVYDDPFARWGVASEHEAPLAHRLSLIDVLLRFFEAMDWHPLGLIFVLALALTMLGATVTRDRRLILLVVWFAALWLPFTILGGLLDPSEPTLRTHLVRYWFLVFPPITIGAIASIQLLIKNLGLGPLRRGAFIASIAAATMSFYIALALNEARGVHRDDDWRELRAWLAEHPQFSLLVTDTRTRQTAAFYSVSATGDVIWNGAFRTFAQRTPDPLDEIVGDDAYLQTRFGARGRPDPTDGWETLWQSSNGVLTIWQRSGHGARP